jgi:hypothetical protein
MIVAAVVIALTAVREGSRMILKIWILPMPQRLGSCPPPFPATLYPPTTPTPNKSNTRPPRATIWRYYRALLQRLDSTAMASCKHEAATHTCTDPTHTHTTPPPPPPHTHTFPHPHLRVHHNQEHQQLKNTLTYGGRWRAVQQVCPVDQNCRKRRLGGAGDVCGRRMSCGGYSGDGGRRGAMEL